MKKEIIAAALLLLVLFGSVYNITVIDRVLYGLEDEVTQAYTSAVAGDYATAKTQMRSAAAHWQALDGYTHIFIRHTEIDSATDAFFTLLSDIAAEDAGNAEGSYGLLIAHLESLRTIEHPTFGSIL